MNRIPSTQRLLCLVAVVLFVFEIVAPSLCAQCDQQAFSFGYNGFGQIGDGSTSDRNSPVFVYPFGALNGKKISAISGGGWHSLVLSSSGQVFSFGLNADGRLGDGSNTNRYTPVAVYTSGVLSGKTITAIAAGGWHSLVLSSSGQVFSFGENYYGQLGDGTTTPRSTPVAVSTSGALSGKTITAIAAGFWHSLVLSSSGQVFSFGNNTIGQLGDGTYSNKYTPVAVSTSGDLSGKTITAIAAGGIHSLVLSSSGQVFGFGSNLDGQLGTTLWYYSSTPVAVDTSGVLNGKTITAIAAGVVHSLVLSSTGQVFSFGDNSAGQLGDGTLTDRNTPVTVSTSGVLNGKTITAISGGYYHSLVLSSSGQAFSFGYNDNGQLGDGTTTTYTNTPVEVDTSGDLSGKIINAVSAGFWHSLVMGGECAIVSSDGPDTPPEFPILVLLISISVGLILIVFILLILVVIVVFLACLVVICLIPKRHPKPQKQTSIVTPIATPIVPMIEKRATLPAFGYTVEPTPAPVAPVGSAPVGSAPVGSFLLQSQNSLFIPITTSTPVGSFGLESNLTPTPSIRENRASMSLDSFFISPDEFSKFQHIGNGSFGVVYRADFRGSAVAVKTLNLDAHHGKEFIQEAVTMAQLRHPRLLQFVGYCNSSNGKFGIVTEFMERGSLDRWLWKRSDPNWALPWPVKMTILKDVASGMAFLHSKGFVHRDLKSPNIFLGSDFRAKIGDFGMARVVDKTSSTMTDNRGTPLWIAPEVIGGTGHYDNKCDVFSFGIIVCEMMNEKEPYYHIENKQVVLMNVFTNPNFRPLIPSVEEVVALHHSQQDKTLIPAVFGAFVTLMQACWTHDPSSRPTFDQVVEQLSRLGATSY